jgi:uncharacterized protein YecT (DUF1311 family)
VIRLSLVAALACFVSVAYAQEKEPTLAEAQARFDKADRALNGAWAAFKKALPANLFEKTKEKQREWLEFRDTQALAASGQSNEAEAKQSPAYFTTAALLTEARTDWFNQRVAKRDEPMTGSWMDGNGGAIDIVEQKGRLLFWLNVARTRGDPKLGNTNLGNLAGIALWNDPIGWFSDKDRKEKEGGETNISFVRDGEELGITEANAGYYQGKGAYFAGRYHKVAPLDEQEQAKVIKAAESGVVPED